MNEDNKSEVLKLIEKLTTSGKKSLDEVLMKKLKNICKSSNEYVNCAYYALMTQLRKNHSEVRYSALLIMNELFCRSHIFRKLLEGDVDEFLELVVESNLERPLPLPKVRAKELKIKGLEFIKDWASKFGKQFIRFKMALNYLEGCKKVDFNDMEARSIAERERQQREEERLERVRKEKVERVKNEIQETRNDIYNLLTQMENCFGLLIPEDELFSSKDFEKHEVSSIVNEEAGNGENTEDTLRHHGIYDMKKGITVEVNQSSKVAVNITDDNQPLIENINDLHKQMSSRYYPMVIRWLKILSKGSNCTDSLKQSIDLKQQIESIFEKFKELKIKPQDSNSSESDEDDFVEVEEKDGYEDKPYEEPRLPNISSEPSCSKELSAAEKAHLWKLKHSEDDVKDPTSAASTLSKRIKSHALSSASSSCTSSSTVPTEDSKSSKSDLLAKAPVLPYDIDLYHWEDEKPVVPEVVKFDSLHKFWESKDDDEENETLKAVQIASLRTRKIDFSGKFEPVKWSCRAPLPSGKLCPRKDRVKCPFHGKIIKRDSTGKPVDSTEDPSASSSTQTTPAVPEWQDPALLRDIEAATGINLKIPEKRGKGSKEKRKKLKSGLTNINVPQTNARERLNKKIMKRYKHYAKKIDDAEKKLFNDKFGDQWNYY